MPYVFYIILFCCSHLCCSYIAFADGRCVDGDCRHGSGTKEYDGGKRYEGQFLYGRPNGEGVYYFNDGSSYASFWADGKPHGKGMLRYPDGRLFHLGFIKGKPMGHGALTQELKEKLIGSFAREVPDEENDATREKPSKTPHPSVWDDGFAR